MYVFVVYDDRERLIYFMLCCSWVCKVQFRYSSVKKLLLSKNLLYDAPTHGDRIKTSARGQD